MNFIFVQALDSVMRPFQPRAVQSRRGESEGMPARPYTTLNVRLPERLAHDLKSEALERGHSFKGVLESYLSRALDRAEQRAMHGWVACNERLPRHQFSVSHELMARLGRLSDRYGVPRSTIANNLLTSDAQVLGSGMGRSGELSGEDRLVA